ncbi:hypothetical protein MWH25_10410 [Natroniella acetigena]|uniref:hypothetical protein n=1 Tax=Natroniella acetigena TaxID=52004 RepID=UPI00200B4B94|nr:hypothetical protein [Natroniella acetigena]MCK8828143.1 hypothetical protein [Natroniella acetigena]
MAQINQEFEDLDQRVEEKKLTLAEYQKVWHNFWNRKMKLEEEFKQLNETLIDLG